MRPVAVCAPLPGDDQAASVTALAQVAARRGVPMALTWPMYRRLVEQFGSAHAAADFVIGLARQTRRPVLLNSPSPRGAGHSVTHLISPPGWTDEEAVGYLAGVAEELQAMFGPADGRPRPGRELWADSRQQRRARERRERKQERRLGW